MVRAIVERQLCELIQLVVTEGNGGGGGGGGLTTCKYMALLQGFGFAVVLHMHVSGVFRGGSGG